MEPNYLVLLGIVIVIIGFALKLDAILIIIVSAVATALVGGIIPKGNVTIGIIVFGVGMMLFTMIMGNAFAAITVMTVGIGAPFVLAYGADPAAIGILALTCGYCGAPFVHADGGQLQHRARCDARHEGPHGRDQEAGAAGDGDDRRADRVHAHRPVTPYSIRIFQAKEPL